MKKFVKTSIFAVSGALLVSQAAYAQYTANDLILGFNKGGGTGPADYILDLGNATTAVGAGGSQQITFNNFNLSMFNSLYSGLSGVSMAAIGGNSATAGRDLYMTVLRTSNIGTPGLAGSTAPLAVASTPMANGVNDVGRIANNLPLAPGGSATVAQSDPNSFFNNVLSTSAGSFLADTGRNPSGSVDSGLLLHEDLYRATPNGAFTYLGYFTLDTSGSGSLTFTGSQFVPVPEPSTYSIIAGSGLLLLTLRRQFKGQLV